MKILIKLILAAWALLAISTAAHADQGKKGSYVPVKAPPASAEVVKVGFYPISVYQLDMSSNTYYVDTYVCEASRVSRRLLSVRRSYNEQRKEQVFT